MRWLRRILPTAPFRFEILFGSLPSTRASSAAKRDIAVTRSRLPNRRPCERLAFEYDGVACLVQIGFRATLRNDGVIDIAPAEIFVEGGKVGSAFQAAARDGGLLLSIAMQHGISLRVFQLSVTRLDDGRAAGVIGAAIDKVVETYGSSAE